MWGEGGGVLFGVISGVVIPPGGPLFALRWGVLKLALLCVVICEMVSVVSSVILLLSWFRTS